MADRDKLWNPLYKKLDNYLIERDKVELTEALIGHLSDEEIYRILEAMDKHY